MRSFSTTALPLASPFSCQQQRNKRSPKQSLASQWTQELEEQEEEQEEEEDAEVAKLLIRERSADEDSTASRVHLTSDYNGSNDSPSDPCLPETRVTSCRNSLQRGESSSSVGERAGSETIRGCLLCGKKRTRASFESVHQVKALWPNAEPPEPVTPNIDNFGRYVTKDGLAYDIDELAVDPLLNLISEWDYPIFELRDAAGDAILSDISYRIFLEAGLFDAFKIPLQVRVSTPCAQPDSCSRFSGVPELLQGFGVWIQGKAVYVLQTPSSLMILIMFELLSALQTTTGLTLPMFCTASIS